MRGYNKKFKPLVDALAKRASKGRNTTHKDYFERKCAELNLNFEEANQALRTSKVITRMSRNQSWPVAILIV